MHLPRWSPEEGGYVLHRDGCRMWGHLPAILPEDREATRSWSLWAAFDAGAIKGGHSTGCYLGTTRVRIGQLTEEQSELLLDAAVVEEAWSDSVTRLLLLASLLGRDDPARRAALRGHLEAAPDPEEAQRRLLAEVGAAAWERATLAMEQEEPAGLVLEPELMEAEPFGGRVPRAVEVSRTLRGAMAYMGHIVSTNGKYTKRGRKVPPKPRHGKRAGNGSMASRKRKFEQLLAAGDAPKH